MLQLSIYDELHLKLPALTERADLCDDLGVILGRYTPVVTAPDFPELNQPLTRLDVDAELHVRLLDLKRPVALRGDQGQVIGRYAPVFIPTGRRSRSPLTQAERDRQMNDTSSHSTMTEALALFESL